MMPQLPQSRTFPASPDHMMMTAAVARSLQPISPSVHRTCSRCFRLLIRQNRETLDTYLTIR